MSNLDSTKLHPAYVAGLIDGEGCLQLRRAHKGQIKPMAIVVVRMCHEETIRRLAECYEPNACYRTDEGRKLKRNWKPSWHVAWRGKKTVPLLKAVRPYLITKVPQADSLLEIGERFVYRLDAPIKGGGWTAEEIERMDELIELVHTLNRRGVRSGEVRQEGKWWSSQNGVERPRARVREAQETLWSC